MGALLKSRAFWLINFANFMDGIAYFGILTLLTIFLHDDLKMSDAGTGLCVSMFTGTVSLFMIFGGTWSDRLGVRRAILSSTAVVALGRGLLTVAPSLPGPTWLQQLLAVVALLIMAASAGVNQPALYAGMKQYSAKEQAAMAYSLLYSIMNLGILAFSFISPYLRTKEPFMLGIHGVGLGVQGVFLVLTVLSALSSLVLTLTFTQRVEAAEAQVVEAPPADQPKSSWRDLPIFADPRFLFFIFALLPVRMLFAHQWLTLPTYVERCFPKEIFAKFEWVSGLNPFIVTIFTPIFSFFLSRTLVLKVMLWGTALSAVSTFLVAAPPNVQGLLAYVILFSFGEAIWSSRFYEYVADLAPPDKVGSYMGIAGVPWFLAKTVTGLFSGTMIGIFIPKGGPLYPASLWMIYACVACITPVALLLARPWLLQDRKKQNADT